jgi:nucleoside-triphosphatase THEP1
MSNIYLFTGEIKSGKTTRLEKWISENPDSDGILAPCINGKRYLKRIKSGKTKLLEYEGNDKKIELTKICNYNFLKSVFDWGQNEIYEAFSQKPEWLIVDEIGPLELRGEALEPMITKILNDKNFCNTNIIFVVRKALVEKVIEHYKLHIKGFKLLFDN